MGLDKELSPRKAPLGSGEKTPSHTYDFLTLKLVELIITRNQKLIGLIKKPLGHDFPKNKKDKPSLFEYLTDLVLKLRRLLDFICSPGNNQQDSVATQYKLDTINPGRSARWLTFDVLNNPKFDENITMIRVINKMLSEESLLELLKIYSTDQERFQVYRLNPENVEFVAFLVDLQSKES